MMIKNIVNIEGIQTDLKTIQDFIQLFPKEKVLSDVEAKLFTEAIELAVKRNTNE